MHWIGIDGEDTWSQSKWSLGTELLFLSLNVCMLDLITAVCGEYKTDNHMLLWSLYLIIEPRLPGGKSRKYTLGFRVCNETAAKQASWSTGQNSSQYPQPRVGWWFGEREGVEIVCVCEVKLAHNKINNLDSPLKFCAEFCIYIVFLMGGSSDQIP